MGQPSSRKNGDLLSSGNAVHAIDGGDASLDHLLRVDTALRIDGLTWKTQKQLDTPRKTMRYVNVRHSCGRHNTGNLTQNNDTIK